VRDLTFIFICIFQDDSEDEYEHYNSSRYRYDASRFVAALRQRCVDPHEGHFGWVMLGKAAGKCFNSLPSRVQFLAGRLEPPLVPTTDSDGEDNDSSVPYRLTRGGSAAQVRQQDLFPRGDFVNMRRTRYAWSLAFPSVFPPRYIDGRWVILGDPTGWIEPRDKAVSYPEWHKWLMWRGDGLPPKHPTFALVINNDQQRNALQGQGRAALYVDSDLSPTITAGEFLHEWQDDDGDGQKKIRS
jgi:hypothetical protein